MAILWWKDWSVIVGGDKTERRALDCAKTEYHRKLIEGRVGIAGSELYKWSRRRYAIQRDRLLDALTAAGIPHGEILSGQGGRRTLVIGSQARTEMRDRAHSRRLPALARNGRKIIDGKKKVSVLMRDASMLVFLGDGALVLIDLAAQTYRVGSVGEYWDDLIDGFIGRKTKAHMLNPEWSRSFTLMTMGG